MMQKSILVTAVLFSIGINVVIAGNIKSNNLLPNPGFELPQEAGYRVAEWRFHRSAGWSRDSFVRTEGRFSFKATSNWKPIESISIPVKAKEKYTLSLDVKNTNNGTVMAIFNFFDENGKAVRLPTQKTFWCWRPFTYWKRFLHTFTVPNGASSLMLRFSKRSGDGQAWFDNARLVKGVELLPMEKLEKGVVSIALDPNKTVGPDKVLLINGAPFFPIGIYGGDFPQLQAAGFNTVIHGWCDRSFGKKYLDEAEKYGLKALCYAADREPDSKARCGVRFKWWGDDIGNCKSTVKMLKNHPALLGWYHYDEPDSHPNVTPEKIVNIYKIIKKIDSEHPVWLYLCEPGANKKYTSGADVVSTANYFVLREDDIAVGGPQLELLKQRMGKKNILCAVLQAEINGSHPTPEQERCITYLALVHGAKAILYFGFHFDEKHLRGNEELQKLWRELKELIRELNVLSPIILSSTPGQNIKSKVVGNRHCPVDVLIKRFKGVFYLFAVNTSKAKIKRMVFNLPRMQIGGSRLQVMFEDRLIKCDGSSFADGFDGYGVHIYTWEKSNEVKQ